MGNGFTFCKDELDAFQGDFLILAGKIHAYYHQSMFTEMSRCLRYHTKASDLLNLLTHLRFVKQYLLQNITALQKLRIAPVLKILHHLKQGGVTSQELTSLLERLTYYTNQFSTNDQKTIQEAATLINAYLFNKDPNKLSALQTLLKTAIAHWQTVLDQKADSAIEHLKNIELKIVSTHDIFSESINHHAIVQAALKQHHRLAAMLLRRSLPVENYKDIHEQLLGLAASNEASRLLSLSIFKQLIHSYCLLINGTPRRHKKHGMYTQRFMTLCQTFWQARSQEAFLTFRTGVTHLMKLLGEKTAKQIALAQIIGETNKLIRQSPSDTDLSSSSSLESTLSLGTYEASPSIGTPEQTISFFTGPNNRRFYKNTSSELLQLGTKLKNNFNGQEDSKQESGQDNKKDPHSDKTLNAPETSQALPTSSDQSLAIIATMDDKTQNALNKKLREQNTPSKRTRSRRQKRKKDQLDNANPTSPTKRMKR